jgi:sugar lactone lactonase YvrE
MMAQQRPVGLPSLAGTPELSDSRRSMILAIVRRRPMSQRFWSRAWALLLLGAGACGSGGASRPAGTISTVCGSDSAGWNGDGLPARETRLSYPVAIAFDREGRLLIADSGNHAIRRVEADGRVRTLLGPPGGEAHAGHGGHGAHAGHMTASAPDAPRPHHPFGIAVALDGAVIVAGNLDPRIYRIDDAGAAAAIVGGDSAGFSGDGGSAARALLDAPLGVDVAPDGALLVADTGNHRIRRIPPDGTITTIAGTGEPGFSGDGGPAAAARLNEPEEARRGPDGSIYISDSGNHRVRRIRADGTIETVCGDGVAASRGDGGDARAASLRHPSGLAFDRRGQLAIAEAYGHRVRLVRLGGTD